MKYSYKKRLGTSRKKCLKADSLVTKNAEVSIKSYKICGNVALDGSNYTSDIFRIWVEYDDHGNSRKKRFIYKVPSLSSHYAFLDALGFYDTEVYMYEVILPEISRLLGFHTEPQYYCTVDSQNLILEDLCEIGYEVEAREMLSFEQSVATMRTLAQFHAASAKLYQAKQFLFANKTKTVLFGKEILKGVTAACNPVLVDVLRNEGVSEISISKFRSYEKEISEKPLFEILDRRTEFGVLNHCNLKTNNILFAYDEEGLPTSAKIIDYQTSYFGSPVFDLIFFSVISTPLHVFQEHSQSLVNTYLSTLNGTLKRLDYSDVYGIEHFKMDMEGAKLFRLFCLIWTGFLGIRATVKNFDYGEHYVPMTPDQIEAIRNNQQFRKGFLEWFRYYERIDLF